MKTYKIAPFRRLIRETAREQDTTDVREIVNLVMDKIHPENYEAYIKDLLIAQVSMELNQIRIQETYRVKNDTSTFTLVKGGTSEVVPSTFVEVDAPAPKIKFNTVKRDSIRDDFFNSTVAVADGSRKRMGDLTVEDVKFVAEVRFEQAKANERTAKMYLDLAAVMEKQNAATLADVDYNLIRKTLQA